MSDEDNAHQNAADPAEDHKTPGGNPGDDVSRNAPTMDSETVVETPGGTTVTESPAE